LYDLDEEEVFHVLEDLHFVFAMTRAACCSVHAVGITLTFREYYTPQSVYKVANQKYTKNSRSSSI
jgi:hypothetical protein